MSHRLRRAALSSAIIWSSLLGAACGGGEGGASAGPAAPNASQAAKPADAAGGAAQANAGTQRIEMGDDVFLPAVLNVPAGTKVTWVNKGSKAHTVVSNEKLFDSGLVNVGGEFSHTFTAPGAYLYHCAPHAKMVGRIVVQ
ncbi:MAG TPA: plastocyanin/azurin family copper-binding protein [Pyrinomonadaceae bacterium]|jgi:plastocyanin